MVFIPENPPSILKDNVRGVNTFFGGGRTTKKWVFGLGLFFRGSFANDPYKEQPATEGSARGALSPSRCFARALTYLRSVDIFLVPNHGRHPCRFL